MYSAYHHNNSQKGFIAQIALVVVGLVIASAGFLLYTYKFKPAPPPPPAPPVLTVPKDAVQISGCLPFMGDHWVELDKLPRGPYYVVYNGKVTALEYMYKLSEIPGHDFSNMSQAESQAYIQKNNVTFAQLMKTLIPDNIEFPANFTPKFWDIEWSPPHAGLVEPHYDLHFYNVNSKADLRGICPNATLNDALTPGMAAEMKRLGVPLP